MSLKFFWIPARSVGDEEAALNKFLSSHRVLGIQRELVQDAASSGWAISVEVADGSSGASSAQGSGGRTKVDYQAVLDPQTFSLFAALRSKRKELADREGIPAYAIITNEQMANMAQLRPCRVDDMRRIEGFGEARIGKYGETLLSVVETATLCPRRETQEG